MRVGDGGGAIQDTRVGDVSSPPVAGLTPSLLRREEKWRLYGVQTPVTRLVWLLGHTRNLPLWE